MSVCSIKAPEPSADLGTGGHSRPILVVKYLGQIEAYAVYRNGNYEFSVSSEIAEAINSGDIKTEFQLDDSFPVGIVLAKA